MIDISYKLSELVLKNAEVDSFLDEELSEKKLIDDLGYDSINIPRLYVTQQMMIGNTLRIVKNFYMLSGILYGAQLGTMGNNWGMGTREGFIWHPSAMVSVMLWNQYFQSVSVYSPVIYPNVSGSGAAIKMPATPEVFSFGLQASFVVGEFIIGIGTSVTPKPFKPSDSLYR